jgi:hypothetical protein
LAFGRSVKDKIPAPNMVDAFSSQPMTGMAAVADRSFVSGLLRDFQPFQTPQTVHAFDVHAKTLLLKQACDTAVPEPRPLTRQFYHPLPQSRLITADLPPVTHTAASQTKAFACPTL